MTKYIVLILFFFSIGLASAQVDTSIVLQKIEIKDHWSNTNIFNDTHDDILEGSRSIDRIRSLAEFVSGSTGIYVKSYGPSSISSISSRGSGASQNLVLWNDIPQNNPMIGQLDFGLISPFLFDKINVSINSSSSNWGAGSIGAVVNLKDQSEWNKGLNYTLVSTIGSFQNYNNAGRLSFSNKKWNLEIEGTKLIGKNNFPYQIAGSSNSTIIKNAEVNQYNLKPSLQYKWNNKHSTSIHAWLSESLRQIPPTTTQDESFANQTDESQKILLQHNVLHHQSQLQIKAYYSDEKLRFTDSLNQIDDGSYFNSYVGQFQYNKKYSLGLNFSLSSQMVRNEAFHPSYQQKRISNEFSSYVGLLKTIQTWKLGLYGRISSFTSNPIQFIPSGKLEKRWNTTLKTSIFVQRIYRHPTLNEFYWIPGGNVDLKEERGWSQESAHIYQPFKEKKNIIFRLSLYNRLIKDWILWTPKEGAFYYTPSNIANVWSRGLDASTDISFQLANHSFSLFSAYHLVYATNQKMISIPSIKKGSQLFYTPRHQGDLNIKWSFLDWHVRVNHQYKSAVIGINEQVPGYFIGDIDIERFIQIKQIEIMLFGSIKNFTNQDYRVIERRPMPGRNYILGIILTNKQRKT